MYDGGYFAKLALLKNNVTVHYDVAQEAFAFLKNLKENDPDTFDRLCENHETAKDSINNEAVFELVPLCKEERSPLSRVARQIFGLKDKYKLVDPFKNVSGKPVTGYWGGEYMCNGGSPNYSTLKSAVSLKI